MLFLFQFSSFPPSTNIMNSQFPGAIWRDWCPLFFWLPILWLFKLPWRILVRGACLPPCPDGLSSICEMPSAPVSALPPSRSASALFSSGNYGSTTPASFSLPGVSSSAGHSYPLAGVVCFILIWAPRFNGWSNL